MKIISTIAIVAIFAFSGCITEPTFSDEVVVTPMGEGDNWKEAVVFKILSSTPELNIHRMNGEEDNQVFVHKNGTEAVFDKNGKPVTTPENKASFNYYHFETRPYAHYSADTKPWIHLGNTRDDPTSKTQRLEAYAKDLAIGIYTTFEERVAVESMKEVIYPSKEEYAAAKKWIRLFENADFDLFEKINRDELISYQDALVCAKSIINDLP